MFQSMVYCPLTGKKQVLVSVEPTYIYVFSTVVLKDHINILTKPLTILLVSSTSILFPITTNGKLSLLLASSSPRQIQELLVSIEKNTAIRTLPGSLGLAWIRNSSLQLSNASKLFALFTSYTKTQQSAPR